MTHQERFWSKVNIADPDDCWLWNRPVSEKTKYPRFSYDGTRTSAHRYVYEITFGPIPEGLVIDHLCRTKTCVNPHHLEAVTNRENIMRGVVADVHRARAARRTECINGHSIVDPSSYSTKQGYRRCLTCTRETSRRQREKKAVVTLLKAGE